VVEKIDMVKPFLSYPSASPLLYAQSPPDAPASCSRRGLFRPSGHLGGGTGKGVALILNLARCDLRDRD